MSAQAIGSSKLSIMADDDVKQTVDSSIYEQTKLL